MLHPGKSENKQTLNATNEGNYKYIKQILVKIEITAPIQQAKQIIQNEIQGVASQRPYNTVQFQLDIDPI